MKNLILRLINDFGVESGAMSDLESSSSFVWKVLVVLLGSCLTFVGLIMLITPGPGLLVIAAGLAVFGLEFHWARKIQERGKVHFQRARELWESKKRN